VELANRDCPDEETLLAFIQGHLSNDVRAVVERHVGGCDACAELATLTAAGLADSACTTRHLHHAWATGTPPIDQLVPGTEVGRYQILGLIGRGGMGEVYSAYHPDLDRRIAIKLVYGARTGDLGYQQHLLKEAQLVARLNHPHIVTVYDAGMVGDRVYVAMEFVDGKTLDVWLREQERGWNEIVEAFVSAGDGLAAAHEAKVVHRDFKPRNVMLGRDGRVRVMDFGLARPLWEVPDPTRRAISVLAARPDTVVTGDAVIGTPAYMAPEQLRGEAVDVRADQYSFCVALYEALHGERPPSEAGKSPSRGRRLPSWLKTVVQRGLEPERENRFPSMRGLLRAIERGRNRPRRRLLIMLGPALLLAGLAVWRAARVGQITCTPPAERIAAVWPAEETAGSRRAVLHHAFLASALPGPEKVWTRVASILDDHVAQWAAMYKDSCEATHLRGEQSGEVLDLRTTCLSENLDEIRAYTDGILNGDAGDLRRALPTANALSPVRQCADVKSLRLQIPLPKDEKTRAAVERLQQRIKDANELLSFGYAEKANNELTAILAEARLVQYQPILAQTLDSLGLIATRFMWFTRAKDLSWQALRLAISSHDDLTAAKAVDRLGALDTYLANYDDADRWFTLGEAILDRLNSRDSLIGGWLLNDHANLYYYRGDFAAAEVGFRSAIMLKRRVLGDAHPDIAGSLSNLALTLQQMNRPEEAYATVESAVQIDQYGDQESPTLAMVLTVEGEIQLETSRFAEAETTLKRAIDIEETSSERADALLAVTLTDYSKLLLARHQPAAAIPSARRARTLMAKSDFLEKTVLADTATALAEALGESGVDRPSARRLVADACETYSRAGFVRKKEQILSWFNRVLRRSGAAAATSCEEMLGDRRPGHI
jgi:serine/threonine protein kinase/Tfp pilus assembly protein PilF